MPELTDVERRLVAATAAGEQLDLRPAPDTAVRAGVVRDLLLGVLGPADPRGLQLRGAVLDGPLDLDGLRTGRRLRLRDCRLPGLVLRGARLPLLDLGGCTVGGLLADDAAIDGSVLLWRGFACAGLVSFVGARIGGKLDLSGSRLAGGSGAALVADRVTVGGDLMLDDAVGTGATPAGTVQLTGARIAGRLSGRRLTLTNPDGPGLSAANLHVTDMVDLSRGIEVHGAGRDGAVRLVGAQVGSLSLGSARLENPSGWALSAHYLHVDGTLYLDRLTAVGGLRLSGGRIGGQLDLHASEVTGALAESAVSGLRLQVAQGMVLDDAVLASTGAADPTVDLRSARIGGDLRLNRTRLDNPAGTALRLNTATVDGRVVIDRLTIEHGDLDLRDSVVGSLFDDPTRVPAGVEPGGLVYGGLPGRPGVTVDDRLGWLARMGAYSAQPYRQLAAAYQAAGHEDEARRVLVAQQEHLHRSGRLSGWGRARHRLFGLTLQYGYQPARAVALLLAVLAIAVGLFLGLAGGSRTPGGGPCPAVDRVGLAVDAAVPLVSTGAADRCQLATDTASGQGLAAAGWVLTLFGWASATLVVAGYSGWVRRR